MQVVHAGAIGEIAWQARNAVLALGTLDGVHRGHQAILDRACRTAVEHDGVPAALTFAQHPLEVVRPQEAPPLLTPLPLKLALLEQAGMAAAVVLHFSPELAALDAWEFVDAVLVRRLRVAGVSVGMDFGFGRGRKGNVELLRSAADRYGFRLEVVAQVRVGDQVVSSRAIRTLLADGKLREAQDLLGRPYCLAGVVQRGAGRGRQLGFATANLAVPTRGPLPDGVYAGRVLVRQTFRDAMMNLGRAPTFPDGERRLEIHLPGWEDPLYGEQLLVFFLTRLRDEQRFSDADALTRQLKNDQAAAESAWRASAGFPWPEWALHL